MEFTNIKNIWVDSSETADVSMNDLDNYNVSVYPNESVGKSEHSEHKNGPTLISKVSTCPEVDNETKVKSGFVPTSSVKEGKVSNEGAMQEEAEKVYETSDRCLTSGVRDKQDCRIILHAEQHPEKRFLCHSCGKEFTKNPDLIHHLQTHEDEKKFPCSECGRSFVTALGLKCHSFSHKNFYKCSVCGKRYKSQSLMAYHMRRHTAKKQYRCSVCNKEFKNQIVLITHLKTHKGVQSFGCSICKQSFSNVSRLYGHLMTHSSGEGFACMVCNKQFKSSTSLDLHMQKHKPDDKEEKLCDPIAKKLMNCPICDKSFKKVHFWAHMRIHAKEGPNTCSICGVGFPFRTELERHMEAHSTERRYKCAKCGATYKQSASLRKHMKGHKIQSIKCTFCDDRFDHRREVDLHMQQRHATEGHLCRICNKPFGSLPSLVIHAMAHRTASFIECPICLLQVKTSKALSHHMKVHSGAKPFACRVCDARLETHGGLRRHLKSHEQADGQNSTGGHSTSVTANDTLHATGLPGTSTGVTRPGIENDPFRCAFCPRTFHTPGGLTVHMKCLHNAKKDDAKIANDEQSVKQNDYKTMRSLLHVDSFSEDNRFPCTFCSKTFVNQAGLTTHLTSEHETESANDELSATNYTTMRSLLRAESVIDENNRYLCSFCPRTFAMKCGLVIHVKFAHKVGENTTKTPSGVHSVTRNDDSAVQSLMHVESFVENNPFACRFCSRTFATKGGLKTHLSRGAHKAVDNHVQFTKDVSKESVDCQGQSSSVSLKEMPLESLEHDVKDFNMSSEEEHPTVKLENEITVSPPNDQRPSQSTRNVESKAENSRVPCPRCEKTFLTQARVQKHLRYVHKDTESLSAESHGLTDQILATLRQNNAEDSTGESVPARSQVYDVLCPKCPKKYTTQQSLKRHLTQAHNYKAVEALVKWPRYGHPRVPLASPEGDSERISNRQEPVYAQSIMVSPTPSTSSSFDSSADYSDKRHLANVRGNEHQSLQSLVPVRLHKSSTNSEDCAEDAEPFQASRDDKPFKCFVCNDCFSSKDNVVAHLNTHKEQASVSFPSQLVVVRPRQIDDKSHIQNSASLPSRVVVVRPRQNDDETTLVKQEFKESVVNEHDQRPVENQDGENFTARPERSVLSQVFGVLGQATVKEEPQ